MRFKSKHIYQISFAMLVISLTYFAIRGASIKPLWMDEILTLINISEDSLFKMLAGISRNTETHPPLYFILVWFWKFIPGETPFIVRIFSLVGFIGGYIILWQLLHKSFNELSALLGLLLISTSPLVFALIMEARQYGLYFLLSVLAIYTSTRLASSEEQTPPWILLAHWLFIVALLNTHYIALLFVAAIVAVSILGEFKSGRIRRSVILTNLASFIGLAVWIPGIGNHLDVGRPHSWIAEPDLAQLIITILQANLLLALLVMGLVGMNLIKHHKQIIQKKFWLELKGVEFHLASISILFLGTVLFLWVYSKIFNPLFVTRYFTPILAAWSITIAILVHGLRDKRAASTGNNTTEQQTKGSGKLKSAGVGLGILLCSGFVLAMANWNLKQIKSTEQLFPDLTVLYPEHKHLPVVLESPHLFLPLRHYHGNRHIFILDWPSALDKRNVLNATVDFKLMLAQQKENSIEEITSSDQFLKKNSAFLVVNEKDRMWFELKIQSNPDFRTNKLGLYPPEPIGIPEEKIPDIYLVKRLPGSDPD